MGAPLLSHGGSQRRKFPAGIFKRFLPIERQFQKKYRAWTLGLGTGFTCPEIIRGDRAEGPDAAPVFANDPEG